MTVDLPSKPIQARALEKYRAAALDPNRESSTLNIADGEGVFLKITRADGELVGTFVFRATIRRTSKQCNAGIGRADLTAQAKFSESLRLARIAAKSPREQCAAGIDPAGEKRETKQAATVERQRAEKTLRVVVKEFHAADAEHEQANDWSDGHREERVDSIMRHLPAEMLDAPIGDITPQALLKVLAGMRGKEGRKEGDARVGRRKAGEPIHDTMQRVRQRLDAVFAHAQFMGYCTGNPAQAVRKKLPKKPKGERNNHFRALPYADAPALLAKLRAKVGISFLCAEFLMLTAARSEEARGCTWDEIDETGRTWVVPADRMKADEPHTVFLSAPALAVLERVKAMGLENDDGLVFPSPMKGTTMTDMALLKVLMIVGVHEVSTVHGLRSTFSTWANETRAAHPDVIECALAHKEEDRVRAAYNRAEFLDDRRKLLDDWAVYLTGRRRRK